VMNKRTDHNEVRNLIFYVKGIWRRYSFFCTVFESSSLF
jgi:hypothetical protein